MRLPKPFPACPNCDDGANQSFHRKCPKGGSTPLEIETDSDPMRVYCLDCGHNWEIYESNYYCLCGHHFQTEDVLDEVNAIVANAKLVARELRRNAETMKRIENLTNTEISRHIEKVIKPKFGDVVWGLIKNSLGIIVSAVRKALGI